MKTKNRVQLKGFQKKNEFLLYQPKHDDYLAVFHESEAVQQTAWCSHPSRAIKFGSVALALKRAKQILEEKDFGYELVICQLHESNNQFAVEDVKRLKNSPFNQ